MKRVQSKKKDGGGGLYFAAPKPDSEFVSSGCTLLDMTLGGGWLPGRMSNIIGDSSTGKTLLAIEHCSNFGKKYLDGNIWYRETEAAFDRGYAEALGMPVDRIDFGSNEFRTIEDIFDDMKNCIKASSGKNPQPGLYIIDSLDALSDEAEMGREITKGSYGAEKAKLLSQLFRRLNQDIAQSNIHVQVISQVRDKIGFIGYGDPTTRSGGKALTFYSSQIIKLKKMESLTRTVHGEKIRIGIRVKSQCIKNKVGFEGRECEFILRFAYGIEDFWAGMEYLIDRKATKEIGLTIEQAEKWIEDEPNWDKLTFEARKEKVDNAVRKVWHEIMKSIIPVRRKY